MVRNMTLDAQATAPPSLTQLMFSDGTPKRAALTALVVGSILTLINHGDLMMAGTVPPVLKVFLTYCVPYCVTTWGAMGGKRAQWLRDKETLCRVE